MSDVVPHRKAIRHIGRLRSFRSDVDYLDFAPQRGTTVYMLDGSSGAATCLGCHDTPCIEINEADFSLGGILSEFPGDPSRDVCPVNAIYWSIEETAPVVDPDVCVGCGLCATRCPYGAIRLTENGIATVETSDPDGITHPAVDNSTTHDEHTRQGALGTPQTPFARCIPDILISMTDTQATRLTRNLFTAIGVRANMRRKGDTNIRMDGLLRFGSGQIGVVELEVGSAVLESPRSLLEDIAVLHNRFDVPLSDIIPVSVIGSLPNVRVEYYQVIDDIEKVLNIRCRTFTIGSLCMLAWHFIELDGITGKAFTTAARDTDLYPSIKALCPNRNYEEPYLGAYRPPK